MYEQTNTHVGWREKDVAGSAEVSADDGHFLIGTCATA